MGLFTPSLLIALGAIVAIVMIHEAGHLIAARRCGMLTTEYFLGFGPRIWSFRRGEMEYGIKAIMAGGYVKIIGMTDAEDVDSADEDRAYRSQAAPRRVLVGLAGVGAQVVLALILAFGAVFTLGLPDSNSVVVESLASWSTPAVPAAIAGLERGDQIVSINGHRVDASSDFSKLLFAPPRPSTVVVRRGGVTKVLSITPVLSSNVRTGDSLGSVTTAPRYLIGVSLGQGTRHYGVIGSGVESLKWVGTISTGVVAGLGHLLSPAGLSHYAHVVTSSSAAKAAAQSGNRPESIVGIVRTTAQSEQGGALLFVAMLVVIDLAIAILNLLPILPLDGGHVAIAAYEGIRSRRGQRYHANLKPFLAFSSAVVVLLGLVVVTSVWLDIAYPIVQH
jgi:membrane-associated protease RseP (regulator of RpoE activity)